MIQTEHISGGIFCEILVEEKKRGGVNVFFQWGELVEAGLFFS